jgi:hypothetical protein
VHQWHSHETIDLIRQRCMLPSIQIGLLQHLRVSLFQRRIPAEPLARFFVGLLSSFACSFRELARVVSGKGGAVREEGREGGEQGDERVGVGVDEEFRVGEATD